MTVYTLTMVDDVGTATVRGFRKISEAVEYAENSGAIQFTISFTKEEKQDEPGRTQSGGESKPRV